MSEIVGVVEDGKYETLTEGPRLAYFIPILQRYSSTIVLVARSRRNDLGLAGAMRQAVENLDPQLPVYGVGSLRQMLGAVYLPMHAAAIALGAFGVLAMYAVCHRDLRPGRLHRVAADARDRHSDGDWRSAVARAAAGFGRAGVLVSCGAAIGFVLGAAAAKLFASIIDQASSRDPMVLIAGVLLIAFIGVVAVYGPARRALRIDPVQALRAD